MIVRQTNVFDIIKMPVYIFDYMFLDTSYKMQENFFILAHNTTNYLVVPQYLFQILLYFTHYSYVCRLYIIIIEIVTVKFYFEHNLFKLKFY